MKKQNSMLKSARIKKSWTPAFVSERVGVSIYTYTRWEAGAQIPRSSSLIALCRVFEMSATELGFTELSAGRKQAFFEDMKPQSPTDQITTRATSEPSLSPETLEAWKKDIDHCWYLYMVGGQEDLERLLPTYLANLSKPTLYPGPDQKAAARLTALVYQLIALIELQRGNFLVAQTHGTQALVYSQLSRDWNIYIAAQIRLAIICNTRKRVGSALNAYNDALKRVNVAPEEISPILHSWIFAGLADIQATMGREREALQFLQLAFTVFPDSPSDDSCFSYTQCDRSMLYYYEGLVFLRLGQPKLAWEAFSQVDELKPAPPERIRADFLRLKTYTSLVLGNMVQSCIYLEAAARASQEIHSDLAFSEIYGLYEHMLALWGQESRVRMLAMLFQK